MPGQDGEKNGKVLEEANKDKEAGKNGKGMTSGGHEDQSPSKDLLVATSSGNNKEKSIFGHEDSDWEELVQYEPSRKTILSFLDERVKRNHTMRNFAESMDDVHAGLESEVAAILQIASNLYEQHETVCLESEDEIEYFVMENYERRSDLQKELEKSAQQAQGLFANLLSRLGQSMS